jgi:hypothetical protein
VPTYSPSLASPITLGLVLSRTPGGGGGTRAHRGAGHPASGPLPALGRQAVQLEFFFYIFYTNSFKRCEREIARRRGSARRTGGAQA